MSLTLLRSKLFVYGLSLLLGGGGLLFGAPISAEEKDPPLNTQLNEQVVYIPLTNNPDIKLQVTLFHPDGMGPFPLAVLNHGKNYGPSKNEKRYRSVYLARYFVSRGYAVILPMMRGFAGSGGNSWVKGCNAEKEGFQQALDIADILHSLDRNEEIPIAFDMQKIVVSGQSLGGWNSLAVGALNIPGVRGVVNFAGGRSAPMCPGWQQNLAIAAGHYAQRTQTPSIWFYGDNDQKFPPLVWKGMFQRYSESGGNVELVAYGSFMEDAHNFVGRVEALPIWTPKLDAFLQRIGLPHTVLNSALLPSSYPSPSGFAELQDVQAVPLVDAKGREIYRDFLKAKSPKVFMISTSGSAFLVRGGYDPLAQAKNSCRQNGNVCEPYAINDDVVWRGLHPSSSR